MAQRAVGHLTTIQHLTIKQQGSRPWSRRAASERRGDSLKRCQDFHRKATARTVLYVPISALTVLYVPNSLDTGAGNDLEEDPHTVEEVGLCRVEGPSAVVE